MIDTNNNSDPFDWPYINLLNYYSEIIGGGSALKELSQAKNFIIINDIEFGVSSEGATFGGDTNIIQSSEIQERL